MDYKSFKLYDSEAGKVVNGLCIADCMNVIDFENDSNQSEGNSVPYNLKELAVSDVLFCSYCNVSFADATDQRNHYKLDWHRYNLKRALSGIQSVPEELFDTLADDISSISGSSDDEGSSATSDTDVCELVKSFSCENFKPRFKTHRYTKVFFKNNENKILSLYRCLLQSKKETLTKDELVKNALNLIEKPKKWMIVMLGGGHFAAAVFDNGNVMHHKTFHCYTVRAKQGGSQSTRDNKGGSHAKSAGASLRRYNEQALIQHVQEIMGVWCEPIKQCNLILYRATGPYNRGVLFGGKTPLLSKTDYRLRNIPFPTRRATFKEVKRVHDMLSSIELYGSADYFKDKFPRSPDKRTWSPKNKKNTSVDGSSSENKEAERSPGKKPSPRKSRVNARASPQREIPGENIQSPSESSDDDESDEYELVSSEFTVSFTDLQEFEDTVPQYIKDLKRGNQQKKKKKKLTKKHKIKVERKKWTEEFGRIQGNLVRSCKNGDRNLLLESLSLYDSLPEREAGEPEENKKSCLFTKQDFIDCLNAPINEESKNTLLHLAAIKCLPDFITKLLMAGADPSNKNKNKLTPYVIAGDKDTRNSFRSFVASFPDKFDIKKAQIPEPLTEEQEKEVEEKKKEKKKLKRMREKIKKAEDKEKVVEEKEKEKFLALSDREKCALAAERRFIASTTANLKSSKVPVLSRCFQCGIDITGKVPFEYGNNRFCTIPCLKAHRLKTNSYGVEI